MAPKTPKRARKKKGVAWNKGLKIGKKDALTSRQFSRLVKLWIVDAGFDPDDYGVDSLRRTKALHILKGTGDLQVVRKLLGHANVEGVSRFLGLETNSDPLEVCRAFDI